MTCSRSILKRTSFQGQGRHGEFVLKESSESSATDGQIRSSWRGNNILCVLTVGAVYDRPRFLSFRLWAVIDRPYSMSNKEISRTREKCYRHSPFRGS